MLNIDIFLLVIKFCIVRLFFQGTRVNSLFSSGESVGNVKLIKTKHVEFEKIPALIPKNAEKCVSHAKLTATLYP